LNTVASAPRAGRAMRGLSAVVVRLEVRRLMRNRRTLLFTMIVPALFFVIFGLNSTYVVQRAGVGNTSAVVMISLALYGAVLATSSGGAVVSIERATGWTRKLRTTPLSPVAYIVIKMIGCLVLAAASVFTVYIIGAFTGKSLMPDHIWVVTGLAVWVGSLLFAAFGLFVGYLLPSENVMQILGFALMLFSFGGGLFIPLRQFSHPLQKAAAFTPVYGLSQLVHYPLMGGQFHWTWVLNAIGWTALFSAGAIWRFRHDTARV
jgi:ABC-2 type transport system permease protein